MQNDLTEEVYAQVSNYRESPLYTARERAAIDFAERYCYDHSSMDDDYWVGLRALFADDEILDLSTCVACFVGGGRQLAVLGIQRESPSEIP